jgi:hypothetical protein
LILTDKELSTIQRLLGTIEGVAYGMDKKISCPIWDAIEAIDFILRKDGDK